MYKISVLVSGSGSTLNNLAYHCYDQYDGMLYGWVEIAHVVADRDCKAIQEIAPRWNIPASVIRREDYPTVEDWSNALFQFDAHLHVMGGFLSKVVVPERLTNRIINIHPSLLPAYGGQGMYGLRVHEAVINNKEQFSGCTVHVVDNEYDHGPIIGQIKVGVLPWDDAQSLQASVQSMEQKLYPRTILNYLQTSKDKNC